ncbi:MAG: hypothetical protein NT018_01275 [Armatimonadetes bacterium]|nr:hypothetical protein [Armatimonadota bacterium]
MATVTGLRTRISLGDANSNLEIRLSRRVFTAGGGLSGVVLLKLAKEMDIRSLVVMVKGAEISPGISIRGPKHPPKSFFQRDVLLSGRDQPRFASERIAQYWNAFLKRDTCRVLSVGEYAYPFSIALPTSIPPSCEGKTGRIVYSITARLQFPLGRSQQICFEVPVTFASLELEDEGFSLSHSAVFGGKHATGADICVSLPSRVFALGTSIRGQIMLSNPRNVEMKRMTVSLNVCDGSRSAARGELDLRCVDSMVITPENPSASLITLDFETAIPSDAPSSVEGTSMFVAWSLGVSVESRPPLEIQVPVIVHLPVT